MRVVLLLAAVLLFSGCIASGPPEDVARRALETLILDITSADGKLSRLSGTMSSQGYSVPFSLDIGRDGTRHFNLSVAGFAIDVYCRSEEVVRIVEGVPYLVRASPDACPLSSTRYGDPAAILAQMTLVSAEREGVGLNATFRAVATDADVGEDLSVGNLTLTLDGRGRTRHLSMTSPGGSVEADASYEPRRSSVTLPETQKRLAAAIEADDDVNDGAYEWRVDDDLTEPVKWSELEARVADRNGTQVAALALDPGERNASGMLLRVEDHNGDGLVNESERFTLAIEGWQDRSQYTITVWDAWAGSPVVERRIPMGPPGLLAIAIVAAAIVYRVSRQRG